MEINFDHLPEAGRLRARRGAPTRPAAAARRARPKKRKRRLFFPCCAAACASLAALWLAAVAQPARLSGLARGAAGAVSSMLPVDLGGAWDDATRAAIAALAETYPEARAMLEEPDAWPAEVAALLARNEEALGFVLAYPSLRDSAPPDAVEEAENGAFPALLQWDARWGCTPYAGSILALTGCGPTVLSVAACGLTGDGRWTPAAIAEWAQGHGYATESGTSWELMGEGCAQFGLESEELPLSEAAVLRALEAGRPVICSVRPGDFTTAGHFIILTGVEDGKIRLVDPNSPARSAMLWEYERLHPQIKNLWAYSARETSLF